jgi:enoyl-CoA hydratase
MGTLVQYEVADSVATITMDDGKANALTFDMFTELNEAFNRAEAEGAGVVLAGRDGRFSAGFDLKILGTGSSQTSALLRAGFETSYRMLSFPLPVVIACTGHAFAMGSFLLLSGDHRLGVAHGDYKITANEVAIGMTMPRAAIEICRQRLTINHFDRVVILAEVFNPDTAIAAGFLDEVVPAEELLDIAHQRAIRLMSLNMRAHTSTKMRAREASLAALRTAIEADDADLSGLAG